MYAQSNFEQVEMLYLWLLISQAYAKRVRYEISFKVNLVLLVLIYSLFGEKYTFIFVRSVQADFFGPMGYELRSLIPPRINAPANINADDEMHLILEYKSDETIDNVATTRSNRFIVTGDQQNKNASLLLDMYRYISDEPEHLPHFVVLAGFHMLEQLPLKIQRDHLRNAASGLLKHQMFHDDRGPAVHLELASIASPNLLSEIVQKIITPVDNYRSRLKQYKKPEWSQNNQSLDRPYGMVHSIGCNEQELAALYESMGGTYFNGDEPKMRPDEEVLASLKDNRLESQEVDPFLDMVKSFAFVDSREQLTSAIPDVTAVASAIRFIMWRTIRLSRFHFHSYAYHIVAQRDVMIPERFRVWDWKTPNVSVAAGSAEATRKACQISKDDELDPNDFQIVAPRSIDVGDPILQLGLENGSAPGVHGTATIEGFMHSKRTQNEVDISISKWHWPDLANVLSKIYQSKKEPKSFRIIEFAYAPVVLCRNPRATVGLGDAISAAGLNAHIKSVIIPGHFGVLQETFKDKTMFTHPEELEKTLGRFSEVFHQKELERKEQEKLLEQEKQRKEEEARKAQELEEERKREEEERKRLEEERLLQDDLPLGVSSEEEIWEYALSSPYEFFFNMYLFNVHTELMEELMEQQSQESCQQDADETDETFELNREREPPKEDQSVLEYKYIMGAFGIVDEEEEEEDDDEEEEWYEGDTEDELNLVGGHRRDGAVGRRKGVRKDNSDDNPKEKVVLHFKDEDYPRHLQYPTPLEERDLSYFDDFFDEDRERELADLRQQIEEETAEVNLRRLYYRIERGSNEVAPDNPWFDPMKDDDDDEIVAEEDDDTYLDDVDSEEGQENFETIEDEIAYDGENNDEEHWKEYQEDEEVLDEPAGEDEEQAEENNEREDTDIEDYLEDQLESYSDEDEHVYKE